MSSLLARFAESSFWMARYMQRAENLARILDVNETFARNAFGQTDWEPILHLHGDEQRFGELYRRVDTARVARFYIIDEANPNSIRRCVNSARENARSIRHLISLEAWTQLNVFHNSMASLTTRSLRVTELSRLLGRIKEGCQLHFGIANSTLFRDQVWSFYRLGTFLELCDQTTRLVDMKYHALLPQSLDVGTQVDVGQWNALLRSASAYHGYRRVFPREMTPTTVAGFILLNPQFPRSITRCARELRATIDELLANVELSGTSFPTDGLDSLEALASREPEEVIDYGLHEYLDEVQIQLNSVGSQIARHFFLVEPTAFERERDVAAESVLSR